jgi:putative tricarboxylic transport membrane protein
MKLTCKRALKLGGAGLVALALAAAAPAQAWEPTEEIEFITHVGTESSTWAFANKVAEIMRAENLAPHGVTIRITEGARGAKARSYVGIDHAGDPHKLQVIVPSQINNAILAQSEVNKDLFQGVAMMIVSPKTITVNANSDFQTFQDLIDYAKEHPDELIQGGGDFGTTASMTNRIIEDEYGVQLKYAPFDDQGVLQLLGGHVQFIVEQPEQVAEFVKAGRMRILAASAKLPDFPDVPTFEDEGITFQLLQSYRGFWTSKEVPQEAIDWYVQTFEKVLKSDAFQEYIRENAMVEFWITGDKFAELVEAEHEAYTKLNTEMGLIGK